jgi:predicted metal-dependent HD superfamily phosphohydrolase
MLHSEELTNHIAVYVNGLFRRYQKPILLYHNLAHTKDVVARANEIAAKYSLNKSELFIIIVAAWFHDCGHLFGPAAGHEERSALIMRNYFSEKKIEENILYDIEQCILATKLPYNPKSLLAQIVCDADSYHLGTSEFLITNELVKKEFQLRNNYLPTNWEESTLLLLTNHTFFTTYCKALLEQGKQKNIALMCERRGRSVTTNHSTAAPQLCSEHMCL